MTFSFRPITGADAEQIARWRYPTPYDFYNLEGHYEGFLEPEFHYHVAENEEGALAAFLCWGRDSRVAGFQYDDSAVDIGWGLNPELTGRGFGRTFAANAVNFASQKSQARRFRATIAKFNQRCQRVAESAGFVRTATFIRLGDGRGFIVMARAAAE